MKKSWILSSLLLACVIAAAGLVSASEKAAPAPAPAVAAPASPAVPAPAAPAPAPAVKAKRRVWTGVVEEKDGVMMLRCRAGLLPLIGGVSKEMTGRKCRVSGFEEKGPDGKASIKVVKCDEVKKTPGMERRKARREVPKKAAPKKAEEVKPGTAPAAPAAPAPAPQEPAPAPVR